MECYRTTSLNRLTMPNGAFNNILRQKNHESLSVSAFFACSAPPGRQAGRGKRLQKGSADVMPTLHRVLEVREPVRIVRPEVGPPILYVLLDDIEQIVQVGRHYRDGRTCPCDCDAPCDSFRLDYFMRALRLSTIDPSGCHHWEPVVLHLTDQAIRTVETQVQTRGLIGGLAGVKARFNRKGSSSNGRIEVREVDRAVISTPVRVSVRNVLTLRRVEGFSPLYETKHRQSALELPNEDQIVPPARSRNDKPRVPLGKRG